MSFWGWIAPGLVVISIIGARLGQAWLKKLVEKAVDHEFDSKLEKVRSDLRLNESRVNSLQSSVLSNRAGRRTIIDKRRIEALENIWLASLKLGPLQQAMSVLAMVKLDALDERAPRDPNLAEWVKIIIGADIDTKKNPIASLGAQEERPFLPADVWATFSAYFLLSSFAFSRLKILTMGLENPKQFFSEENVIQIAKTALPDRATFIEQYGIGAIGHLGTPLREQLLSQIQRALDGHELDQADLNQSAEMMKLISRAQNLATKAQLEGK